MHKAIQNAINAHIPFVPNSGLAKQHKALVAQHRAKAQALVLSARGELELVKRGEYNKSPATRLLYADNYLEQAVDLFALADLLDRRV